MDDITINPQRNSNCSLQASSLNGGNLAQSFNLQGLRIIKGYIKLYDIDPPYPNNSAKTFILDYYTGNPLQLPPCGCIISIAIENASSEPLPTLPSNPYYISITNSQPPIYDTLNNTWIIQNDNDTTVRPFASASISSLNSGVVFNVNTVYSPAYNFLLAIFDGSGYFNYPTIPNPTLRVSILLIDATLSQ